MGGPGGLVRGPPQHGLYPDTMARIISDCDAMRSPSIQMARITSPSLLLQADLDPETQRAVDAAFAQYEIEKAEAEEVRGSRGWGPVARLPSGSARRRAGGHW